ncbi:DUF3667 domain-containing protein [Aquimarina brevivitae]|uniref:Uncharacterized protein DUF3667 n=1 Tax=Aquimarina brevivitae TaxID=323412 RepID=A0A4Q7NY77_9FLAO|nr:DUF3667 domain-containing protein [Aquimarina brevivitae]RZS92265.1 uncharacterized protein DUF3667 [Aquimarina brevivitae]
MNKITSGDVLELYTCKSCEVQITGQFCSHCGQKKIEGRWNFNKLLRSLTNAVFNLEKGFFYTFKSLFAQPGVVIKNYLHGATVKFTNPFKYAIIGFTFYSSVLFILGYWDIFEIEYAKSSVNNPDNSTWIEKTIIEHINYIKSVFHLLPFLVLPFLSIGSRVAFATKKLNFIEFLIIHSFAIAQSSMYYALLMLLFYIAKINVSLELLLSFLLLLLMYAQIYKRKLGMAHWKGFFYAILSIALTLILVLVIVFVAALIAGIIIGIIKGHQEAEMALILY